MINGLGLGHPIIFDRHSKTTKVYDNENDYIRMYLRLLLLSKKGEYFSDPLYGCTLSELVYSPNDSILMDQVKDSIVAAVRTYAPSIILSFDDISITQDELSINININYRLSNNSSARSLNLVILNTEVA